MTSIPDIKRGQYLLISTDGTETMIQKKPRMKEVCIAISCSGIDTVTLKHRPRIVMMVDDTGMLDGKPVNAKATALYHGVCKPGTVWAIHGDVAIVHDGDFTA